MLEIRAKAHMDGALWTTLQHRLYRAFATVGGAVEIGAILSTAALAWTVREHAGRWLAGVAFGCFAVAFAVVWLGMVAPVNRRVARWDPAAVPADWERWRRQWDAGHAVRFGLQLLGFWLLVELLVVLGPTAGST
ncbi:MAG: anthrone oxygenase family protein [Gemmatimonadaceae bacterium]